MNHNSNGIDLPNWKSQWSENSNNSSFWNEVGMIRCDDDDNPSTEIGSRSLEPMSVANSSSATTTESISTTTQQNSEFLKRSIEDKNTVIESLPPKKRRIPQVESCSTSEPTNNSNDNLEKESKQAIKTETQSNPPPPLGTQPSLPNLFAGLPVDPEKTMIPIGSILPLLCQLPQLANTLATLSQGGGAQAGSTVGQVPNDALSGALMSMLAAQFTAFATSSVSNPMNAFTLPNQSQQTLHPDQRQQPQQQNQQNQHNHNTQSDQLQQKQPLHQQGISRSNAPGNQSIRPVGSHDDKDKSGMIRPTTRPQMEPRQRTESVDLWESGMFTAKGGGADGSNSAYKFPSSLPSGSYQTSLLSALDDNISPETQVLRTIGGVGMITAKRQSKGEGSSMEGGNNNTASNSLKLASSSGDQRRMASRSDDVHRNSNGKKHDFSGLISLSIASASFDSMDSDDWKQKRTASDSNDEVFDNQRPSRLSSDSATHHDSVSDLLKAASNADDSIYRTVSASSTNSKKNRGKYRCGRCGMPKTNHVCTVASEVVAIVCNQGIQTDPDSIVTGYPFVTEKTITINKNRTTIQDEEAEEDVVVKPESS